MSHRSERDSSRESEKKRATPRTHKSSRKDAPRRTEDESRTSERGLTATEPEDESREAETLSQEEIQILDDLHALEMVLGELISRRSRVSNDSKVDILSPSTDLSLTPDVESTVGERPSVTGEIQPVTEERRSVVGERQSVSVERRSVEDERQSREAERKSIALEGELVEDDVRRLDKFLGALDNRRSRALSTPPTTPTGIRKDSRLSHIVALDDDITKEIEKVDVELRKKATPGIPIRGTLEPPSSPSASNATSSSAPMTRTVTEDSQNDRKVESAGKEGSWFSFESFNVPSETSSVQTLPQSDSELIVQYNPDFVGLSPDDPFIERTIQKILELRMNFPDQSLYLIPSSSLPAAELPQLSSVFEIATSTQSYSQMEESSDSSFPPGRRPFVPVSSSDATAPASIDVGTLSEEAILKQLGNLLGQTLINLVSESLPIVSSPVDADSERGNAGPLIEAAVPQNEKTVSDDFVVAPDDVALDEGEQRARTVSLPAADIKGVAHPKVISQARETSSAVPLSTVASAQPEAAGRVAVMPDVRPIPINAATTSKQSEASDNSVLRSSLKTSSATQNTVKQKPATSCASISSNDVVESAALSTNTSSIVKKKVSFADMNSTMYIIGFESATKSSEESNNLESSCEAETAEYEGDTEATPRNTPLTSLCHCSAPRQVTSTPASPSRTTVMPCSSKEAHRVSSPLVADVSPSSQAMTGSITHVMCRARSSAEQGRVICGSKERWVTRVNSRSLSFCGDDDVCPSWRSDSLHSDIGGCMSLPGVSPAASDVAAAELRLHSSCSNCTTNRNCSCSKKRHGEGPDSLASDKEHAACSTGSFQGDTGSVSSLGDCIITASESLSSNGCSTVSIVFDKRGRTRTKDNISETKF